MIHRSRPSGRGSLLPGGEHFGETLPVHRRRTNGVLSATEGAWGSAAAQTSEMNSFRTLTKSGNNRTERAAPIPSRLSYAARRAAGSPRLRRPGPEVERPALLPGRGRKTSISSPSSFLFWREPAAIFLTASIGSPSPLSPAARSMKAMEMTSTANNLFLNSVGAKPKRRRFPCRASSRTSWKLNF